MKWKVTSHSTTQEDICCIFVLIERILFNNSYVCSGTFSRKMFLIKGGLILIDSHMTFQRKEGFFSYICHKLGRNLKTAQVGKKLM